MKNFLFASRDFELPSGVLVAGSGLFLSISIFVRWARNVAPSIVLREKGESSAGDSVCFLNCGPRSFLFTRSVEWPTYNNSCGVGERVVAERAAT